MRHTSLPLPAKLCLLWPVPPPPPPGSPSQVNGLLLLSSLKLPLLVPFLRTLLSAHPPGLTHHFLPILPGHGPPGLGDPPTLRGPNTDRSLSLLWVGGRCAGGTCARPCLHLWSCRGTPPRAGGSTMTPSHTWGLGADPQRPLESALTSTATPVSKSRSEKEREGKGRRREAAGGEEGRPSGEREWGSPSGRQRDPPAPP